MADDFVVDELPDEENDEGNDNFIEGEEDYVDEGPALSQQIKDTWSKFYRRRLIDLKLYKIRIPKGGYRKDASNALISVCKSLNVSVYDVIDLLELGADPNARGGESETPLHWIARRGHYHILWPFLAPEVPTNINATDNRHSSALMLACDVYSSAQVAIVRALLKRSDIKVNIRDSGGNTALLNAVYKNNVWVLRELLQHRAVSVLERQEPEDPNAYEVAQWIFASGLLLEAEEIDPDILEPGTGNRFRLWPDGWRVLGRYRHSAIVAAQTLWTYDAEICFRMIQRKSYLEGRRPTPLLGKSPDLSHRVNNRHKEVMEKYYSPKKPEKKRKELSIEERDRIQREKRQQRNLMRGHMREKRELEHWNMRRKANAMKVDADFDIALHKGNGKKETRALSTLKQQREDSLYSRRFEWKQIQEETSKNNWQLKPKVSKAVYTTVPDVPKATKPTDITWTQAMTHYS